MPKLIEIVGSPGSGKSFISSKLEELKKNDSQIFFHSGNFSFNNEYNHLNLFLKFFIRIKIIFKIIFFYLIFHKRIFLKKIYKRNFFLRVILLYYKHLLYLEILRKTLPDNKYLIIEPGPIMYFIQDYFYIDKEISNNEINIFNKLFLKADYIINLNCNFEVLLDRLKTRKRGLPSRMRELSDSQIETTIIKTIKTTNDYIKKSNNLNAVVIDIDSSKNFESIKKKFLDIIE